MELTAIATTFVVALGVGLAGARAMLEAVFFFMNHPAAQYETLNTGGEALVADTRLDATR